jgi:transcriptional regulator with XRE-family HTH domain
VTGSDDRTFRAEVGQRARYMRQAAGRSQATLGRLAGLTDHQVSELERGRVPVDLDVLARLADALCVPVDLDVLARLADALCVPVDRLIGDDPTG